MTVLLQKDDSRPAAVNVDKSAAVADSHAARRPLPKEPPRGRRSPACGPLRAPRRHPPRRLRRIAVVRGRAGGARGVRPDLGRAQLFLAHPAAAPADLGGAVARADRYSHRVVAVQARHPHDDGDLRRRDAHRRCHVLLLPKGQSEPGRETGARRRAGDAGHGPAVAGRAVPGAPRHRLARMPPLPGRARRTVIGGADGPGGRVLPASIRLQIRALGCRCGRRPDERRRVGGRSRDCGPVEPRDRRSVPPGRKLPHIVMVVEGAGGPSWYTEYNVLTGLSVRSYGRFAESVTRLAAGRVKRGLPYALRECGYNTYSLYSWFGAFAGARGFQTSTGIEHFLDAKQLHVGPADTDIFFYDRAAELIAQARGGGPVFVFVYLAANHFPWDYHYRPDLLPNWVNPGNPFEIDEYLRRQEMSARDYAQFKARLGREFPNEQFLLVRFGDHQPLFAKRFIDPTLDQAEVAARILQRDPRYFTTYYAAEGVNFRPVDLSSALDTLDAPYLPLVVLEGAGVPLDAAFLEQKKILKRCRGLFYLCAGGAEARRFNRLLIDAGLIQGF